MSVLLHDWTIDPVTGRSNSSGRYEALVNDVEQLILDSGSSLIRGYTNGVARLIVSQLAHKHGMKPEQE